MPFRAKKGGKPKGNFRDQRGSGKSFKDKKKKFAKDRPPKYGKPEPRKVEDSPFAALAALKKDLPKDGS